MPYINEAIYALYEGIGTKEDIDKTMKLGTNVPMGPLTLADFIGLDTCLSIMHVLHRDLGDSKYRACPLSSNTGIPSSSKRRSSSFAMSKPSTYEKPEHPPPFTPTLSP